jgi:hypothetical protein
MVKLFLIFPLFSFAHPFCEKVFQTYSACRSSQIQMRGTGIELQNSQSRITVPCDDQRKLSFYDRMEKPDLVSILKIPYAKGIIPLPEIRKNFDPGRIRLEILLKTIYGGSADEVRKNLVPVEFLGQTVRFQKRLGAAAALERTGKELVLEAERDPSLKKFLNPFLDAKKDLSKMTFNWRKVAGTDRLSTHSFGTGIDMLTDFPNQYWLWDEKQKNPEKAALGEIAYKNDHFIPKAAPYFHARAVEIFEKNGFIWGGKWNHYDTMHFEYRPEFFSGIEINCADRVSPIRANMNEVFPLFHLFGEEEELPHDH